jgi:hypothetical protein
MTPVYDVRLVAAGPKGVPGEPEAGIWERQVAARDEAHAVEAAEELFPGWTVLTVQEES